MIAHNNTPGRAGFQKEQTRAPVINVIGVWRWLPKVEKEAKS
jgi:hypothetical protein